MMKVGDIVTLVKGSDLHKQLCNAYKVDRFNLIWEEPEEVKQLYIENDPRYNEAYSDARHKAWQADLEKFPVELPPQLHDETLVFGTVTLVEEYGSPGMIKHFPGFSHYVAYIRWDYPVEWVMNWEDEDKAAYVPMRGDFTFYSIDEVDSYLNEENYVWPIMVSNHLTIPCTGTGKRYTRREMAVIDGYYYSVPYLEELV